MPLFKKNHNDPLNTTSSAAHTGATMSGGGPGMTAGELNYSPSNPASGKDMDHIHPDFSGHSAGEPYGQPHSGTGMGVGIPPSQGGYYRGSSPTEEHQIPPSTALGAGRQGGAQHGMTGKVEHAVGSMIGSKSLKAKGIQKEQEAQAFKMQGSELAEAERLEREALMRRERAVAHGAHPNHRHLGGIPPGSNQTGGF